MFKRVLPLTLAASAAFAASVTVNPSDTKQEIVGFGGGSVYYQSWITALAEENQKALYDTAFTGLNLSLLRIANWLQSDENLANPQDSLAADIQIVKAAKERLGNHVKIEMSSWSAPGKLKQSGSVNGNDGKSAADNTLKTSTNDKYGKYVYADFANWWKTSLEKYASVGITPDFISFQNEPDMNADYEETLFSPTEKTDTAGYAQALNAVYDAVKTMPNAPKILGPEPLGIGYENFQKYMKELDETKLDGYAYHIYHAGDGNDNSGNNYLNPENFRKSMKAIGSEYGTGNKPIIMTEFCNMLNITREEDMVGLAHIMQVGFTDGKLSGYIAWELFWGNGQGQLIGVCTENWGSCNKDEIVIGPEYHAMRHYSKFVNPGWKVVSTNTEENDLKTVAFSNGNDSVSVIIVNTGKTEIKLDNPVISGMGIVTAVQSKEDGFKSKAITISDCTVLPARSITTLVYKKDAAPAAAEPGCKDETTDPDYHPPVQVPTEDVVIVDYSVTKSAEGWSKTKDELGEVTYEAGTLDGVTGYVNVPLAGCKQEECGYKQQLLKISENATEALGQCDNLVVTMRSADKSNAYVNIGGAAGSSWVDYNYGNAAPAGKWSDTKLSLKNEGQNGSTDLTFNADASGIYIAKIVATNCHENSPIAKLPTIPSDQHIRTVIFDLNGNAVWKGFKSEALNSNGTLRINVRQGMYVVKTKFGTTKAIKK